MGFDQRFSGDRDDQDRWVEELASTHRIDVDLARELLARARREAAEDPYGRSVRACFAELVEELDRDEELAPGKRTRVQALADGGHWRGTSAGRRPPAPGKSTLTMS